MGKGDTEDSGARRKANKSKGEHRPPPTEKATPPPVVVEGALPPPSFTPFPSHVPPASVSPKDSPMTSPFTPLPTPSPGVLRPNGRAFRRRDVLSIQPPSETPDGFVAKSIVRLAHISGGDDKVRQVNDRLLAEGLVEEVGKATARLNLGGINRTQRLLLSIPPVYASIIDAALGASDVPPAPPPTHPVPELRGGSGASAAAVTTPSRRPVDFDDTEGLIDFILRALDRVGGFRDQYAKLLVEAVVLARGLQLSEKVKQAVIDDAGQSDLPIPSARVDEVIVNLINRRRSTLDLDSAVDEYAKSGEIDPVRFTPSVRRAMASFLREIGVTLPEGGITEENRTRFDEYFALAYNHAVRVGDGSTTDPIDAVRTRGAITDWDFTVDTFETVEEQGVVPQNILAAGALDYVYNLGERLGMFKLADALVLRWASGAFDAEPGTPSADLYRYWKLRSERISPEERAMMYRRILAKGDGNLLSGMVENDAFPPLWGTLMEKATDFMRRSEENASSERTVSRQPIYQATKQLQYNLTEHATGMAHMQITEMYHHLLEAKKVLEHAISYFSTGSRKSLWTVIERASREWFDEAPNISAIRSSAIDGNRVFQWIANFDQAGVTDEQFQAFLDAAEAWILAQVTDDTEPTLTTEEDEEDIEAELNEADDDWDK